MVSSTIWIRGNSKFIFFFLAELISLEHELFHVGNDDWQPGETAITSNTGDCAVEDVSLELLKHEYE